MVYLNHKCFSATFVSRYTSNYESRAADVVNKMQVFTLQYLHTVLSTSPLFVSVFGCFGYMLLTFSF